ncbi:MAG: T9SS type A sorting domain-containing protein, partial [Sphingobacteriaceae bacterium]
VDSVKVCKPLIGSDTLQVQYVRTSNGVLTIEVTETPLFVVPVSYGTSATSRSSYVNGEMKSSQDSVTAVTTSATNNQVRLIDKDSSTVKKSTAQVDLQTAIHTQTIEKGLLKIDAKMAVYPNPASTSSTVTFVADANNESVIKVIDACTGKVVVHFKVGKGTNGIMRQIDLSRLASGLYEVQLIQGKHQQHQSLIKAAR